MNKKKPRILIIRCGLLGDTIDSTAVVKPLVEYYGNDLEIEWVTKPNLKDLFMFDRRITPLFVRFTKLPLLLNFDKLKIIIKSYLKPYDAVINLEIGNKFISLAKFTKANVKAGLPNNFIAENRLGEHRVQHQLRIIKSCYTELEINQTYPYLVGSGISIKKKYNLHNDYIVMCPTNSKFKKKNHRGFRAWPLDNWNKLIGKVLDKTNLDIVITGGKNEKEFIDQLEIKNSRIHNLCGKTSIPNLVDIMKGSRSVIANDSGSVHVAGVSSPKVIALHGPTPFKQTGPYGNGQNKIIEANLNLECSPCYNTDAIKLCHSNKCMIDLSPNMIFKYIIE